MILLIDNYDSFVHNLARYLQRLGQATCVVRNDAISIGDIESLSPKAIILSPGPRTPREAGISLELVRQFHARLPILGVCLGHQAIGEAFGGRTIRAPQPMHGQASLVTHHGDGLLAGLPNPFPACRYHSLMVDPDQLPDCLEAIGWTEKRIIMALRHRQFPVMGVQFHPESILTPVGYHVLAGFLRCAGLAIPTRIPPPEDELSVSDRPLSPLPQGPVTF